MSSIYSTGTAVDNRQVHTGIWNGNVPLQPAISTHQATLDYEANTKGIKIRKKKRRDKQEGE